MEEGRAMLVRSWRCCRLKTAMIGMAVMATGAVQAQTTLDSPPNLANWLAVGGGIQFNLLHRFSIGPAPSRKLQNAPTAAVVYGATPWLSVGINYASASEVVQAYPNEWEFLARTAPFTQDAGAPIDLYLQGGYNIAAESPDAQLLVGRQVGPVRALAGVGVLGDAFHTGATRATLAAGAVLRLRRLVGLAADVSSVVDRADGDLIAWSGGITLGIAGTPHTMSIHATNVASRTLQGIARGTGRTRYGFEYTIPINLSRGRAGNAPAASPAQGTGSLRGDTISVDIRSLRYSRREITVPVGTTVVWRNRDPLAHTVTGDSTAFDSGEIQPESRWSLTFTTPGTYSYHCTPHPHMQATVVVRSIPPESKGTH